MADCVTRGDANRICPDLWSEKSVCHLLKILVSNTVFIDIDSKFFYKYGKG